MTDKMKIKYLLVVVLIYFLQTGITSGQKLLNQQLLAYAKNSPDSAETSFLNLASYLRGGAQNDRETVEAIFYWIAINIAYSDDPYCQSVASDSVAKFTLMTRKSGCEGTARLFYELCKAAQIECVVIFGIAEGSTLGGKRITRPNHGWNAVKLNGKWELADATWGSGGSTMVGDSAVYITELDMRYLFAKPESFIIDHFPEDNQWQLLEKPISRRTFLSDEYDIKRMAKLTKFN
jgi:transglutaminase/protease-like cytokinesis protein 3